MNTTRFNPSTNGCLHLGHAYAMLVNERFAHENGGKFYVRFDDNGPIERILPQEQVKAISENQATDIKWLGLAVDGWSWQSHLLPEVTDELQRLGWETMEEDELPVLPYFIRMEPTWEPFPFVPQQTAERVIMDNMLGITHIIRGDEFSTEYGFYSFLCKKWKLFIPEFTFLPRLEGMCGSISKTNGGYTLTEMRSNGYTAEQIKKMLEKACLYYPANGWDIHNLKRNPRINL
jgi:glutamyl/glutaminyl-tRNA synthetase